MFKCDLFAIWKGFVLSTKSFSLAKISKEPFFVVLATIVFIFLFLGAGPGQTLSPTYIFQIREGWQEFEFVSSPGASMERSDILDVELPLWIEAKEAITTGEGTLLENRNGGRNITNFTFGLLSPSFIVFLLVPDNGIAWYLSLFVQMTLMMTGYYALGRLFAPASIILFALSGAATFSGYVSGWFYAAPAEVLAIAPWFIFSTLAFLRKITPTRLFGLFIASFFTISAGSPHVASLFLIMSAFLVMTNILVADEKLDALRKFAYWALAIFLSFLVQVRWLYTFVQEIQAAPLADRNDMGSAFRTGPDLLGTIYPFFMGNPTAERSTFLGILVLGTVAATLLTLGRIRSSNKPVEPEAKLALAFAIIFILSVGYSFNWPLLNMIRLLPTLDNSLASRGFAAVILTSFVLSSIALGLALRSEKMNKIQLQAIFLTLTFVSLGVSKQVFDYFNPSSPLSQFHPEPSAVEYLSENSGRFDYTLSDNTFLFNGTLTGFGVKEWFAHSQINRDPDYESAYSQISSDPKKSPTNVAPSLGSIDFSEDLLDEMSVTYLITARNTGPLVYESRRGERSQVAREIRQDSVISSIISLQDEAKPSEISLLLATYGVPKVELDKPLDVTVELDDGARKKLCKSSFEVLRDNSWVTLECGASDVDGLGPGEVEVSLKVGELPKGLRLASWSYEASENLPGNSQNSETESILRLYEPLSSIDRSGWEVEELEHATIYRNLDSPRGPYIISDGRMMFGEENLSWRITPGNSILAKIKNDGLLVFPVGKHGFQKLSINGEAINADLHRGIMPSVTVKAGDEVTLSFEDTALGLVEAVEFSSILLLGLMLRTVAVRGKRNYASPKSIYLGS